MKDKFYSLCIVVVLFVSVMIIVGCNKNDNNNPQEPAQVQKYHMVVNAAKREDNKANGPKRVLGLDGATLNATWAIGEEVTVYNETKHTAISGVLSAQSNGASTTLEGELTGIIEPSDVLTLKFLSPNYIEQKGTLEYISANCDYAEASVTVASVSSGNITPTTDAVFENKQAIVKFTLIDKADGTTLLKPATLTINDGTSDIATLTDIPASTYTTNGDGVLYVAIPGFADKTLTLTATIGAYTYTYMKGHASFSNGQYYTITMKVVKGLTIGALPGEFSISPTKKIRFSKGNLWYNAMAGTHQCADGTTKQGTWKFAENQYDTIGHSQQARGSSYDGWIDSYPWGTSGWNSGAVKYQPWDISNNYADFYPGGSQTNDIVGTYAYADWGVYNAISNGGNIPNTWRVLTAEEWNYILNERANHTDLCAAATVNEIPGKIILPDDFIMPNGISFVGFSTNALDNQYSVDEWNMLEANGAIFLTRGVGWSCAMGPTEWQDLCGMYWSSTHGNDTRKALGIVTQSHDIYTVRMRCDSGCVRLVQDVE